MKLDCFTRLLKIKKNLGKSYVMFVGMKELAIPFCFLAKKCGFALDGVVVVKPPQEAMQAMPQDFSEVPIIDPSHPPFPARLCLVVIALPEPLFQSVERSLLFREFNLTIPLLQHEVTELVDALRYENFTPKTVRAAIRNAPDARIAIVDTGSKSRTLEQILRFSGVPIEGVISPSALRIFNPPPCVDCSCRERTTFGTVAGIDTAKCREGTAAVRR